MVRIGLLSLNVDMSTSELGMPLCLQVVRVAVLALKNLLADEKLQLGPDMVEAGLPKVVQQRSTQVGKGLFRDQPWCHCPGPRWPTHCRAASSRALSPQMLRRCSLSHQLIHCTDAACAAPPTHTWACAVCVAQLPARCCRAAVSQAEGVWPLDRGLSGIKLSCSEAVNGHCCRSGTTRMSQLPLSGSKSS